MTPSSGCQVRDNSQSLELTSPDQLQRAVEEAAQGFGPTAGGHVLTVLGDGFCLDRALLVIALLTDERLAR